jgi:hypothetical protein
MGLYSGFMMWMIFNEMVLLWVLGLPADKDDGREAGH